MSEEPLNREDDLQEDVQDTAEDTESGLDKTGDKSKQGSRIQQGKVQRRSKRLLNFGLFFDCNSYFS